MKQFMNLVRTALLTIVTLCTFVFAGHASGQTVFLHADVKDGKTIAGGATGADWANAYKYLQDAIDVAAVFASASTPYIIRVRGFVSPTSAETYYPDEGNTQSNDQQSSRFELTEDVTILGNFIGGTGGDADNRDPAYLTVLSGNLDNLGSATDNAWHVVYAPSGLARNANGTAHIRGCVIRDGYADGGSANNNGGGVFIETNAEPYLRDCVITSNHADGEGGGIWQRTGTDLLLRSCTISDNDAIFGGGFSGGSTAEATRA